MFMGCEPQEIPLWTQPMQTPRGLSLDKLPWKGEEICACGTGGDQILKKLKKKAQMKNPM